MEETAPSRRVVVTGLGVVAALGHEVETFWAGLTAGRPGVRRISLFDPSEFASQIGAEVRDWEAADIANLTTYLCSEEANYITGQVFNVDGGMAM